MPPPKAPLLGGGGVSSALPGYPTGSFGGGVREPLSWDPEPARAILPEVGRSEAGVVMGASKASEAGPPTLMPRFTQPRACVPRFLGGKQGDQPPGHRVECEPGSAPFLASPHCH